MIQSDQFEIIAPDTREEWLKTRRELGIGSSELAALFTKPGERLKGLSSWESPVSLNYRKRGVIGEDRDRSDDLTDHLEWSLYEIEPAVANWFERCVLPGLAAFGACEVVDPGSFAIVTSRDDFPWFATCDRLIVDSETQKVIAPLEIKNAHWTMDSEWSEGIPAPYLLQVQLQIAILGTRYGYVCASVGGSAPRWATVDRDDALIETIRKKIKAFWWYVEADQEPPMDGHEETRFAIAERWPDDNGSTAQLGEDHLSAWQQRQKIHEAIKRLNDAKDIRTHTLKAAIGENSYGQLPGERCLSLVANKAGRRNLKEVTS